MIQAVIKTRVRLQDETAPIERAMDGDTLSTAIEYLDRINDRDVVKSAVIKRFATGLVKRGSGTTQTDGQYDTASGGSDDYDTYTINKSSKAIEVDRYEIVSTGIFGRVAGEVANLFNQKGQDWMYFNGEELDEELKELVFEHRQVGQYDEAVERLDKIAVGVNCDFLRVQFVNGHLGYDVIRPQSIVIHWPESIIEKTGSSEQERAPQQEDLEDALAIVIKLTRADEWMVYAGRSETYEHGRHFVYKGSGTGSDTDELPEVGDDSIKWEYTVNDEPANPLTWLQNDQGADKVKYEYPITRLLGNDAASDKRVIATSHSMYLRAVEIDVSSSRNLTAANNSAQGIIAVTDEHNVGLPEAVVGPIALRRGQTITSTGRDATNAVNAGQVIADLKKEYAESEGVPAYRVLSDSAGPESGAALLIRHQPQLDRRKKRIKLNNEQVTKIGYVEAYLLHLHTDDYELSDDLRIQWQPGNWEPPRDATELIAELKEAKAIGAIDDVDIIQRYHNLETREDAEALKGLMVVEAAQLSKADALIGKLNGLSRKPAEQSEQNNGSQDGGSTVDVASGPSGSDR